jgi:uncharacterized protein YcfJ
MAVQQINPRVKTQQTGSRGSGGGSQIGAGLGAVIGGIAGIAGGPAGVAAGAAQGASLGGLAGGLVAPGKADTRQIVQERMASVPTADLAAQSQKLLDGIRSLDAIPAAKAKYLQPLTDAYIQSKMELKRR